MGGIKSHCLYRRQPSDICYFLAASFLPAFDIRELLDLRFPYDPLNIFPRRVLESPLPIQSSTIFNILTFIYRMLAEQP